MEVPACLINFFVSHSQTDPRRLERGTCSHEIDDLRNSIRAFWPNYRFGTAKRLHEVPG